MGKRRAKFFAIIAAVCLALTLGLTACVESKASVTLDKTALAIERFDTATITATVEGTTGEVVWSSDNEGVATVSGGVVTAVAAGVATITAKVGDASATCAVTVTDSGYFPVLNMGKSELSLIESATYTLTPGVTFRGNGVTASFTYEVADSAVATVSDAGVITAVKEGTTTVTVRSSYVGYALEETVTVKVMENSSITLSDSSVSLATSKPDGTDYLTSKTVTADVVDKGADGDAGNIVWSTGSDTVATVSGGVITAVGEGTTTVTATYVTTSGKTITATVAVEVIIPVVKYDGSFDWDLTVGKVQLDVNTIANKGSADVVRVEYGDSVVTTSVVDDDKIKLDGVKFGEKTFTVYFADIAYNVDVVVANKIVTTKDELSNLKNYLDQGVNGVWDGYFIIDADIDMNGGKFTPFQIWTNGLANGAYGFKGVIDGRGHVISNVTVDGDNQSIVGYALMADGVVKNLGFVDVDASGRNATVVAFRSYGLIENVFVKANGTNRSNLSGLVSSVAHGTYENVFVYVDETGSSGDSVGSVIGTTNAKATLTNVFAVASLQIIGSDPNASILTNCGKSLSLAAFKEAEYNLGGFDTEYWTVDGKIPLFKSYADMLSDLAITSTKTELFAKDEVKFEANHEATFSAQTEIPGVTVLPDGTVKVAAELNESEFTLVLVATSQFDSTKTATATISIKAVRRQDITDTYRIELGGSDISVTLNGVTGTITKVTDSKGETVPATIAGNKITFTKDALAAVGFGKQRLSFVTDEMIYDATNVYIYSKIVTTKAELENLKSYATQVSTGVWDGYFVIDNDIDMAGGHFSNIQGWMNATNGTYGFKGTIDGQGHIISNVVSGGETQNLVGYLLADGTVKNIGFVNATLTGKSPTLVAFRSYGTIENVFAVAERSVGSNNQFSGVIANLSHADMKNCTVYVNDTNTTTGVVGSHVGNAETAFKFTNCWAVATLNYTGSGAKICGGGQKFTRPNSIGQRKSVEALKNQTKDRDLTKLDTTYWDITTYGVPVFKGFEKYVNAIAAINAPTEVNGGGETVTLKANGRALFEIVGETTAATITSVGKLTTAETVAEDTVVTVRIKSEFDTSKYTDIQITVKKTLPKETLPDTYTADVTAPLTIAADKFDGTISKVYYGSTALDFTATDGLTLAASEVAKIGYGETKSIRVLTDRKDYTVNLDVYSKIITTKEDFLNMKSFLVAKTEFPGTRYDGRIALGANIDIGGEKFSTMEAHASSGGSWNTYGFRGTFDGKGYTVSNLGGFNGTSATYGIFGIVGADAVIKNVAFVNATIDGSACGLFSMRMHGTIENVYVQGTRTTGGNWSGAFAGLNHGTIKNCMVNVDDSGSAATNNGALIGNAETDCTIENCFAVSSKSALVGNENGKTVTITNCGIAASAEDFAKLADLNLSVLSADYWDTASGFPVFKTKA